MTCGEGGDERDGRGEGSKPTSRGRRVPLKLASTGRRHPEPRKLSRLWRVWCWRQPEVPAAVWPRNHFIMRVKDGNARS